MKKSYFTLLLIFLLSCGEHSHEIIDKKLIENIDYCRDCNDLESAFKSKDSVYGLYLSYFTLNSVDTISTLKNLKLIQLSDCQDLNLKIFIDSISKIKSIEILNFRSCGINEITENISKLNNLKSFGIEFDTVFNVSNKLFELTNLEELTLTTISLSDSILLLHNLKEVNINILDQDCFPGVLKGMNNIEYANISNAAKFITSDISTFKKLRRIDISGSAYEKRIQKYLHSTDKRIQHRYQDSISALKRLLPNNCVIVTSGNIKW